MSATSRELVHQTLNFENPARAPRQLWLLQWAVDHYPEELAKIQVDFPPDITCAPGYLIQPLRTQGESQRKGQYVDDWGCIFENIQDGVVGEVKDPIVKDWAEDGNNVRFPEEWFSIQPDLINKYCSETDTFVYAGFCARPFERLQFLRGTVQLYMDLMDPSPEMLEFAKKLHDFDCKCMELWAKTDVDGLMFMDDWGSQQALLINPKTWREFFKPRYADFAQIAHSAGKKIFMHSDGNISEVYPDLIEIGVDAVNSQLFAMGVENLSRYAGKITFWGEIDRQHILPNGQTEDVDAAVKLVYDNLWRNGGCIAQCEFGAGANPRNVYQVFKAWDALFE